MSPAESIFDTAFRNLSSATFDKSASRSKFVPRMMCKTSKHHVLIYFSGQINTVAISSRCITVQSLCISPSLSPTKGIQVFLMPGKKPARRIFGVLHLLPRGDCTKNCPETCSLIQSVQIMHTYKHIQTYIYIK